MINAQCKKCRRAGQKLFLKGDRCFTPKCAMIKKPYPPGLHGKKRKRNLSEYGSQLVEKQKLKRIYNISEKQLRKYYKQASRSKDIATDALLRTLESRLDNVIFRAGIAESRAKARQIVTHGHILLNKRRVDIPSIIVKKGDKLEIKKSSISKPIFKNLETRLKKYSFPNWISFDQKKTKIDISALPEPKNVDIPVDLQMIVEFYSK